MSLGRVTHSVGSLPPESSGDLRRNSFLTEQYGNVIENKEPLWKRSSGGRNVIDYNGDIHRKREYY